MDTTRLRRSAAVLLAGGLGLAPLSGCTGEEANTGSSVLTSASEGAASASSAAGSAAEQADDNVDCSGNSCTVTLNPDAGDVEVLGTRLSYDGVQDGEATITAGDETVSCAEGDTVDAGPLTLECTSVSDDEVVLTATLG
jgi:hypothetical protein